MRLRQTCFEIDRSCQWTFLSIIVVVWTFKWIIESYFKLSNFIVMCHYHWLPEANLPLTRISFWSDFWSKFFPPSVCVISRYDCTQTLKPYSMFIRNTSTLAHLPSENSQSSFKAMDQDLSSYAQHAEVFLLLARQTSIFWSKCRTRVFVQSSSAKDDDHGDSTGP